MGTITESDAIYLQRLRGRIVDDSNLGIKKKERRVKIGGRVIVISAKRSRKAKSAIQIKKLAKR